MGSWHIFLERVYRSFLPNPAYLGRHTRTSEKQVGRVLVFYSILYLNQNY